MAYYDPNARLNVPYTGIMGPFSNSATSAPPGPLMLPDMPQRPAMPPAMGGAAPAAPAPAQRPMGMAGTPPWINVPQAQQGPLWALPALTTGLSLAVPGADPATALLGGVNSLVKQQTLRTQAEAKRRKYELDLNKYGYDVYSGEREANLDERKFGLEGKTYDANRKEFEDKQALARQRLGLEGQRVGIAAGTLQETGRHNLALEENARANTDIARETLGIRRGEALNMDSVETNRIATAVEGALGAKTVKLDDGSYETRWGNSTEIVDPGLMAEMRGLATDIYNKQTLPDGRPNPGYHNPEIAAQMAVDLGTPHGLAKTNKPIPGTSTWLGLGPEKKYVGRAEQPSQQDQDQPSSASQPALPQPGEVHDGYVYQGGPANDPNSWRKVY